MKQRVLSIALVLCLFISSQSVTGAEKEVPSPPEEVSLSQDDGSLPQEAATLSQAEVSLSPEDPLKEEDSSLMQEEDSPAQDDSLTQNDDSLSQDDSLTQDDDSLSQDDSLTQDDDSLSQDDSLTQDDDSLSQQEPPLLQAEDSPAQDNALSQEDTVAPESLSTQEDVLTAESVSLQTASADSTIPTPTQVYTAMIALKDRDEYKEGTPWTNDEPYSDSKGYYRWKGGPLGGHNIAAVGCVAFAFILSDEAFGSLPARMYATGGFTFEDIKVGDILRVNNDVHTVIVLEVNNSGVIVAEGNISTGDHKGKVHWGRAISKEDVMSNTSHYITRYPEGYIPPDDPSASEIIASGTLDGSLTWNLTNAGTLTISGNGAMPDYSSTSEQPWSDYNQKIRTVVIENGVTSIGSCAFWNCQVLGAEIPSSVAVIGNSAFRGSSIVSVTIPSSVKTIGDSAFRECKNLSSATISEGVETIGQNAFQSCASLASIALPASIGEIGHAVFFQCQALTKVTFAPGNKQVQLGDNLFTQCYNLLSVTLPQSINRIGDGMFQNCLMLAGVEIPQGAESIGESAFASSAVSVVVIPDSVSTIGIAAFARCPLKDIYFTGTETQWNSISKIGDTASAVSSATIHYEYRPEPSATPTPTQTPEPSATPGPTATPEPTQAPGQTTVPEPTATPMPAITPEPVPTATPEQTPAPTSTPTVPSISGESGKEGWTAIRDETANASEGKQIHVNMNGTSVVPGDVLDSIKGQNVTISFDMGNGIIWSVNGRNVTAEHANNVDLSVQIGTSGIPQNMVKQVSGDRQAIQINLAHSGDFGYNAVLFINMDSAHGGMYANLFYYNENVGRLEFVTADQINEDGIAELTFTHASDYVIVVDNGIMSGGGGNSSENSDESSSADENSSQEAESRSPKTGETDSVTGQPGAGESASENNYLNFIWLLLIGAAGLTAAGVLACLIQKKTGKEGTR